MLPLTIPTLKSSLVILRAFEPPDAALIASVSSDPLIPLITTVPTSGTVDAVQGYLDRQRQRLSDGDGYSFAIALPESDQAVGQIGLWTKEIGSGRTSIGYWIASAHRRRGYLGAALQTLADWAITLEDVHRLQMFIEPWNEGSWRAAERCGFQREGLLRGWEQVGDDYRDMYVYGRTQ